MNYIKFEDGKMLLTDEWRQHEQKRRFAKGSF